MTAMTTQTAATQGGTPEHPTPQKQPHLMEWMVGGKMRAVESPRVDSHNMQTIGARSRVTPQDSAWTISVPKGSITHLTQPQGSMCQGWDGDMVGFPSPFIVNSCRDPLPHTPMNLAFA